MKATIVIISILCGWAATGRAEDNALRLDDLLKEAMEHNPRIISARETAEAWRDRVPQARAWDDPMAYIGRQPGMEMVGVEQVFPFPGKLTLKGRAARAEADSIEQARDRTILEVMVDVKHAFHHLFHRHKAIEINRENQDILRRFVKIAESRYLVGKVPQEDVLKAQVEAGKLSNEMVMLDQMKKAEEAHLIHLLGRTEETTLPPPEPLRPPPPMALKEEDLYAMAEENRQEIKAEKAMVRAREATRTLARLAYLPDFDVKAEWWRLNSSFDPLGENWGGMVGLRLPLWFIQKQRNGSKEAAAALASAKAGLQEMENRVRYEVKDALLKAKAARAQLDIFNAGLLPQAEQSLRTSTSSYAAGTLSFLMLLDSQRTLRELRNAYYDALVNYYMTLGDLELAVGKELHVHH